MKIIILTMPLAIAEYLPRPSALDARPAFGRAVPTTLPALSVGISRNQFLVLERQKYGMATSSLIWIALGLATILLGAVGKRLASVTTLSLRLKNRYTAVRIWSSDKWE